MQNLGIRFEMCSSKYTFFNYDHCCSGENAFSG